ncbi:YqxA family protein [Bacillus sp. PS06]|uniref:YqxA family protein n=1 Tax=Bacillus sp. PS06 TaxID=2764176 RepID=UPI00178586C6|nr:YqxA family protein [Bacillus sp. PS06]MBD8069211.1 YqxA family protein [Bacillus sp. PS06]
MAKFMMKCFFIASILLIGVLIGMQQANQGMKKMKGYEDSSLQSAFQISAETTGQVEASVLGKKVTSHDLDEKQKQLEEVEAFNLFSTMGRKLGEGVSAVFEKILVELSNGIGKAIDKIG